MAVILREMTPELEGAFENARIVALDVEGVDLGRFGQISLVQIARSGDRCFLLDLLNQDKDAPLVAWLRGILESPSVLKIVHDCRMDSDALKHLLGIHLAHVHDTSAWHYRLRRQKDASLNLVLESNGMRPNVVRDSGVYLKNKAYWATRPMSKRMIEWAQGDVSSMFQLYAIQVGQASPQVTEEANSWSQRHLDMARDARAQTVHVERMGAFIGRGGRHIRQLQDRTNTLIHPRGEGMVLVYYNDNQGLQEVQRIARQ